MRSARVRSGAAALVAVTLAALAASCGSPGAGSAPAAGGDGTLAAQATAAASAVASLTTATPSPRPTPTVDPGTLPQTRAEPSPTDPAFQAGVRDLWAAVVSDRPAGALPLFFPLSAYRQVKAIANPAADWQSRLVGFYDLDIGAIHASLGPAAGSARLLGVTVPMSQAGWVNPGAEYNSIGYWRVYGTRVRYEVAGREGSFGICSLISWRGRWYAVHLGPIVGRSPGVGALCDE